MTLDRKNLVREIFYKIIQQTSDKTPNERNARGELTPIVQCNAIPLGLLMEYFNVECYPSVMSRLMSCAQCKAEMIDMFECGGEDDILSNENSLVTLESFMAYYKGISLAIRSSVEFDEIIRNCWLLEENSRLKKAELRPEHTYNTAGLAAYRITIPKAPSATEFYKPSNMKEREKYQNKNSRNHAKDSNRLVSPRDKLSDAYPYKKRVIITHRDGSEEVIEYNFDEKRTNGVRNGTAFDEHCPPLLSISSGYGGGFDSDRFSNSYTPLSKSTQRQIIRHIENEMGIYDIIDVRV